MCTHTLATPTGSHVQSLVTTTHCAYTCHTHCQTYLCTHTHPQSIFADHAAAQTIKPVQKPSHRHTASHIHNPPPLPPAKSHTTQPSAGTQIHPPLPFFFREAALGPGQSKQHHFSPMNNSAHQWPGSKTTPEGVAVGNGVAAGSGCSHHLLRS